VIIGLSAVIAVLILVILWARATARRRAMCRRRTPREQNFPSPPQKIPY